MSLSLTTQDLLTALENYMGWAASYDLTRADRWINAAYRRFLSGTYHDTDGIIRQYEWSFLRPKSEIVLFPTITATQAAHTVQQAENLISWSCDGTPLVADWRGDPCVVWDAGTSLWRMYMAWNPYDESPPAGQGNIVMMTSPDRVRWSGLTTVMDRSEEPLAAWYMHPYVVKDGATWKMWWCGKHLDATRPGENIHALRYATSSDGVTWTRHSNGNYGIVFSPASNWDPVRFRNIIWDAATAKWHCYFNSNNDEALHGPGRDFGISYMTSPDGITWTRGADVDRFDGALYFDTYVCRWDEPDGTKRFIAFITEFTGALGARRMKLAVWTSSTIDGFKAGGTCTFVGYIAHTETGSSFTLEGVTVAKADTYDLFRQSLVVSDKTCNVTADVQNGTTLWLFCMAYLLAANRPNIFAFRQTSSLGGAVLSGVENRLPLDAPLFRLAPAGDANTLALWLFGEAGGIDVSGHGHDLRIQARSISEVGADMELSEGDDMRRNTGDAPASLWTTGDFFYEFEGTLESTIGEGDVVRLYSLSGGEAAKNHFLWWIEGKADGNHRMCIGARSASANIGANSDYALTWIAGTTRKLAVGRSGSTVYFFADGLLVGATKTMAGTLDTYTGVPIILRIGRSPYSAVNYFDGVISAVRVSNTCRHTEAYTTVALTYNYATSGNAFSPVSDLGSDYSRGVASLVNKVTPAGCTASLYVRLAANATDVSTNIASFTAYTWPLEGRYQQFAVVMTGSGTATPTISHILVSSGLLPLTRMTSTTAAFYPGMVGLTMTFTASGNSYTIAEYASPTTIVLEGNAGGEADGDTATITATGDYALPRDFGGIEEIPVYVGTNHVGDEFRMVAPEHLDMERRDSTTAGTPEYGTIEPRDMTPQEQDQEWLLSVHPIPSAVVTLGYRYRRVVTALSTASPTALATCPVGGRDHGETIKALVLAQAELNTGKVYGEKCVLAEERMRESVGIDRGMFSSRESRDQIEVD